MAAASSLEDLGAKAIADSGVGELPPGYALSEEYRFGSIEESASDGVPVIDLEFFRTGSKEQRELVISQVAEACEKWGFFQITNHGVPESIVSQMFQACKEFFDLPPEEKLKYDVSAVADKWKGVQLDSYGLFSYGVTFKGATANALDWRDWARFEGNLAALHDAFPENPPSLKHAASQYEAAVTKLGETLLEIISQSLGLAPQALRDVFGDNRHLVLFNCYPPCPNPEAVAGLSSHSDPLPLTILAQSDVPGLEILHQGKWVGVKPLRNAFVINLGDIMQILSNGKYKSPEHRARANRKQRFSIAVFMGPSMTASVAPLPQLVNASNPPRYRSCITAEYMDKFYSLKLQGKRCLEYVATKAA